MPENLLIREIAKEIFEKQILQNWIFYIIFLVGQLIVTLLSQYLMSFFKKRGKQLATKADFSEFKAQQEKLTRSIENIKTEITRFDWAKKEYINQRRIQLEKLIETILDLNKAKNYNVKIINLPDLFECIIHNKDKIVKIELITILYFDEYKEYVTAIINNYQKINLLYGSAIISNGQANNTDKIITVNGK